MCHSLNHTFQANRTASRLVIFFVEELHTYTYINIIRTFVMLWMSAKGQHAVIDLLAHCGFLVVVIVGMLWGNFIISFRKVNFRSQLEVLLVVTNSHERTIENIILFWFSLNCMLLYDHHNRGCAVHTEFNK